MGELRKESDLEKLARSGSSPGPTQRRLLTVDDDAHEVIPVVLVNPDGQRVEVAAWLVGNGDFRRIREKAARQTKPPSKEGLPRGARADLVDWSMSSTMLKNGAISILLT